MKKSNKIYHFQIEDGKESFSLNKELLAYFPRLNYIVHYVKSNAIVNNDTIPLVDTPLKLDIIEWIIDGISLLKENPDLDSFDTLYALTKNAHPSILLSSFIKDDSQTLQDISLLAEIATELDWLQSGRLLLLTLKKLYRLIDSLSNITLREQSYLEPPRGLPLTPYYERETSIHVFLRELLPESLIRARYQVQKYIQPIALGSAHQLFLKVGNLYGQGRNERGQLGLPKSSPTVYHELHKLTLEGDPLLIACADSHSLCLTRGGLYGTGDDKYGQLGLSSKSRASYLDQWTMIPTKGEVLILETSERHSVLLTTEGLYVCGANQEGELGVGDRKQRNDWTRIEFSHGPIFRIRCARDVTFLLTSEGLYRAGYQGSTRFQLISSVHGLVSDMDCSTRHFMLATQRALYGLGNNQEGQLGIEEAQSLFTEEHYDTLTRVEPFSKIPELVACGRLFTVTATEDALYGTGDNREGQLGLGDREERHIFTKMQFNETRVRALIAKENTVLFLTSSGLYLTGYMNGLSTTVPKRLSIEMGYRWPERRDETERRRVKLQCEQCSNQARFINQTLPVCSKYCLLQLKRE